VDKATFEPKIVAYCCWWCAYGAADLAGISKLTYPASVRIVRVPCSGRVDPLHVLSAFKAGADGVIVAGCLKDGGCHYVDGNMKAEKRVKTLKKALDSVGIGGDRLEIYFLSAGMPDKFVEYTTEFARRIEQLGPVGLEMNRE